MTTEIFKIKPNDRVTYINQTNDIKWKNWKLYKDCSEKEKIEMNLAYFPENCILLDRDLNTEDRLKIDEDYLGFKKMLIKRGLQYFLSWESPHGYHVLLPMEDFNKFKIEEKEIIREFYIDLFGCDRAKISNKGVVSLPDKPHFKTMKIYKTIEENFGENKIHQEAFDFLKQQLLKKDERKELKELFDFDFKDYFENDEFFKYIKNNIIPDSSERNNIIFPNLAVAAVKSGKTREEIDNIIKPIIQQNFPGKNYNEFLGWLRKAEKQEMTDYNPFMINKWMKEYAKQEKDIYDVSSISVELRDEIAQLEFDIFSLKPNELLRNIDSFLTKINLLEHPILKNHFLGLIAFKIKVSKKELDIRLKDLENKLKTRIKPVSIFDNIDDEVKEEEYIIDKVLPKGKTILIGAKGGRGKSLFVLSLCLATKSKNKYLDTFDIKEDPNILYYSLENGKEREKNRAKYLKPENLREKYNKLDIDYNFEKTNLQYELEKCKEYDMIVLDSFRRFLDGSENDSEVTNRFYTDFLKPLVEMGKTIIIIHHLKKCKLSEIEQEDLLDAFRGSGDIVNQFDSVFLLDRGQENISTDGKILSFDLYVNLAIKNRDGNFVNDICINVSKDDTLKKTIFKFIGNKKPKNQKEKIKTLILDITKDKEIERKDIVSNILSKSSSYSIKAIIRFLEELIDEGLLFKTGYGKYSSGNTVEVQNEI